MAHGFVFRFKCNQSEISLFSNLHGYKLEAFVTCKIYLGQKQSIRNDVYLETAELQNETILLLTNLFTTQRLIHLIEVLFVENVKV